ncbi:Acyl-CoA N-acyltransferase [Penicillium sp. IBT 18751x]|nr:Acyl-CoA N-acyltransferase [Penicillium sp. IBT 18751x]
MAYHIEYATEADGPALARINVESFQGRGLLNNVFPKASEAALRAYKTINAMKHLANPSMHVLKITDPTSGEVVSYARWLIPASVESPSRPALSEQAQIFAQDPTRFAPQPMNEVLFTEFRKLLEKSREKHATDDDMMLDLLATLPGYQGRGIGSTMLKWGTLKADAAGRRLYLEATGEGMPLYLKAGFKPVDEIVLDRSQFGGMGQESFTIMIRDPVAQ